MNWNLRKAKKKRLQVEFLEFTAPCLPTHYVLAIRTYTLYIYSAVCTIYIILHSKNRDLRLNVKNGSRRTSQTKKLIINKKITQHLNTNSKNVVNNKLNPQNSTLGFYFIIQIKYILILGLFYGIINFIFHLKTKIFLEC